MPFSEAPRHETQETPQGRAEHVSRFRLTKRPEGRRAVSSPALENDLEEDEITLVRKRADAEDNGHHPEAFDRIRYGENYENLKKLEEYSLATQQHAWKTIQEMRAAIKSGKPSPDGYEGIRLSLRADLQHLEGLHAYGLNLPASDRLREVNVRNDAGMQSIQHALKEAVAANWSLDTHPEQKKGPIDAESAAMANKFNASAKQIQQSKKSVWGRVKSWFS